jgi:hypothetical protein
MKTNIENIVNEYGFGISVKELVRIVYRELAAMGYSPYIVNDRYIGVDEVTYQLCKTRSKGHWTVKAY